MNGSDAVQAAHMVEAFNPEAVYIYALGQEPWYKYFMGIEYEENSQQLVETQKFIKYCKNRDIPATNLVGKREIMLL